VHRGHRRAYATSTGLAKNLIPTRFRPDFLGIAAIRQGRTTAPATWAGLNSKARSSITPHRPAGEDSRYRVRATEIDLPAARPGLAQAVFITHMARPVGKCKSRCRELVAYYSPQAKLGPVDAGRVYETLRSAARVHGACLPGALPASRNDAHLQADRKRLPRPNSPACNPAPLACPANDTERVLSSCPWHRVVADEVSLDSSSSTSSAPVTA